ncbi:BCCT family transporter [Saccharopolyspora sp. TS4A08]|uniref:BCCT family transporter n=1 Tax=Saccharopolyspora ipomoeae TaxID=3042027 RepID=A0ABT6PQP1_9PSEU|nr:BCCT family transporter [Saccharopolyspora sp. TS4A08]MDI2030217.1 BCCT family transporter [Saccharopolyspora sp. TS4A08]
MSSARWPAATGAVAALMLIVGGGGDSALTGIQNFTFVGALPFGVIVVLMCFALLKDLRNDDITLLEAKSSEILEQAVITGKDEHDGDFQLVTAPAEPPTEGNDATSSDSGSYDSDTSDKAQDAVKA